ncbi:SLC13 family permease [Marinihelvus fidelis]|uniref:SLC13 family permease n=1 Tax=Marinihelvus fidelis TaxID=2613842 RepID=A0A5N0TGT4_9GAMM|nr:SLC13 family permease [Marinihelvus fidelis]KAA9133086.1 SLC13 family permease [Marinihelvus fidelis]
MNFPAMPNDHALAVLLLTGLALFLFTREKIPLESSSLFVLVALAIGFELFPFETDTRVIHAHEFFYGFGHEALVAVCALMIVGQALVRTGALEPVARRLGRFWKWSPALALLLTLLIGGALSAFVNNTPIVVLMLPMLIGAAARSNVSTSGILLPMGFATLVGGMATTIGTSTNLLVVSVAADMGMEKFGMFDFAGPALIGAVAAVIYLWLIAPRMIPERHPPLQDTSSRVFQAELVLDEDNALVGRSVADVVAKAGEDFRIERILRKGLHIAPLPDVSVMAGDRLQVQDTVARLREYTALLGAEVVTAGGRDVDELASGDAQLAEVVVTAGSPLHGMLIRDIRFKERFGLDLLALHRSGTEVSFKTPGLENRRLQASDVLLVQGRARRISLLKRGGELLVLDATSDLPHTRKAPVALFTIIAVVGLAAAGIMPIAYSALLGCLFLVTTRCLEWKDVTRALSAQVILIIVASLALGSALMKTGGADYLAQVFLFASQGLSAPWVLSMLMLMMAILTNIVSNNAAAVIGTPIAIGIASELGMPLEPFVLAVLFGANLSFVTPMAYKTNLLVMNAGGYTFGDFVKVGTPLTILLWIVLSVVLAFSYGLIGI